MRHPPKNQLSARALTVARLSGASAVLIAAPLFAGTAGAIGNYSASAVLLGALLGVAYAVFNSLVVSTMRVRWWRYELLEHEVYLQHGWLMRSRQVIPYVRIQNVDTLQGPIDRLFGLSAVTVSTAGSSSTIRWLDDAVASQLRAQIGAKAGSARSTVDA